VTSCPSDLTLEAYLVEPERSPAAAHVHGCPSCQARLAEMRRAGEEFQREVYPATVARVVDEGARPRRGRWMIVAVPLAAAAALVAFLVLRDRAPGSPRVELAVYLEAPAGVREVSNGAEVPADASLRFRVSPSSPCSLWLLSVNAEGEIVRLYPPRGDAAAEAVVHPPGRGDLPTVSVLDGRSGPQRIFAVCTPTRVPWNTVRQAAAQEVGKGADAVRSFRRIERLPQGAIQTTLLIEKRS
jgi:hypothetical protein